MVTGFVTGLLVGGFAAVAGAPASFVIVAALGLGIPLAIFGIAFDALMDAGRIPFGRIAPVAVSGNGSSDADGALHQEGGATLT